MKLFDKIQRFSLSKELQTQCSFGKEPSRLEKHEFNKAAFISGKKLALFLDFDGTLAEIQTIPDNTYMTKDMTNVLQKISHLDQILTAAVSGRQIDDLQKRIGLEDLVYSGNHGLELNMDGSAVTYCLNEERVDLLRAAIKNIVVELRDKKLGKEVGGNIEEKDTALTWHFFNVPENKAENIVKQAAKIVEKYGFPISGGAGCIEVGLPRTLFFENFRIKTEA